MTTWVFVGDSVTAAGRAPGRPDDLGRGWVADVAGRLGRLDPAARVVNLGVSGDRVEDVRRRVVDDMAAAGVPGGRPGGAPGRADDTGVVVTLAVGINDVRRAHLSGEPFDLRAFARTYASLVPRVRAAVPDGRVRLLFVEPVLAPLDRGQRAWAADLDAVCDYVGTLASSDGAVLVRARAAFAGAGAGQVTRDGIHPTRTGHRVVADAWWRAASEVPGLLPDGTSDQTSDRADGRPDGVLAAGGPRWWDRLRLRLGGG